MFSITFKGRKQYDNHLSLVIRSINKVSPIIVVRVQELEAGLLIHRAHAEITPSIADAHSAQLNWGDMNTSPW
jgi:hypothetical protein